MFILNVPYKAKIKKIFFDKDICDIQDFENEFIF